MKLTGKKVLVTGGAGFIGSHLVDALIQENCHVRVIDNLSNGKRENIEQHRSDPRFEFVLGNVTDPFDLSACMEKVEIVFHLACLGVRHSIKHPFQNHRVNSEGTLLVLQEAYRVGIKRFIYCSSSEVYGTAAYVPMSETHPTNPCTVYGASKLSGEAYARAYYRTYSLETIVVRPFNCYGPRSHHERDAGEMIPKSIVRALNGKPVLVFGDGSQTRDFTYVEDTARGLLAAAKCDDAIGRTLNLGSSFEVPIKQTAELILDMVGSRSDGIEYVKDRRGDVRRLLSDSTLFHGMTNWKPRTGFEEGLLKTIHWFKSRPEGISALLEQEEGINWE